MYTEKKVYLFDGNGLDQWMTRSSDVAGWSVENGILKPYRTASSILTRENFGDSFIHIEFRITEKDAASGIYMHGRYQIQISDSYGVEDPGVFDCGAIYNFMRPRINACKPIGEWQTLNIIFRAPTLRPNGNVSTFARITAFLNDIPIHNNEYFARERGKAIEYDFQDTTGPIMLENKGNGVEFRNIYAIHLN